MGCVRENVRKVIKRDRGKLSLIYKTKELLPLTFEKI